MHRKQSLTQSQSKASIASERSIPRSATEQNIRTICALEAKNLRDRSRLERLGDAIAVQAGKPWCIVAHCIWFGVWIAANAIKPFDPFPYPFLTTAVSLESIFLVLFLLMSQNRSNRQAEERAHLDLQINLLSEDENTKMLRMLQVLCAHHGLDMARDPEVEKLAGQVDAADVVAEIQKHTVKPA
ncbi:MAG TPA: DUF1003 domain-containing protein [Bryobacteraceae bacterium]|nr:DUF1003 domain-containing protein [Bryobacteraceae bacterium]